MSITTSTGTTVSLEQDGENTLVILAAPDAPEDMRRIEAGRLVYNNAGFQPAFFFPGALSVEVLRAIATLIENGDTND